MESAFISILPEGISPAIAVLFLVVALLGSLITAATGAGGGVLLLTIIALWLPPAAVIPVHGLVQAGSNGGRSIMTWKHIHWPTLAWFLPGVVVGLAAGTLLLIRLPEPVWQLLIALFVLYLCWGPPLPEKSVQKAGMTVVGGVTAFISLFVGASGPLVAAFIKRRYRDRFTTVSTLATALFCQHAPKALIFAAAGFAFTDWLPLIAAMIASGALGTWIGLELLGRMTDRRFDTLFNLLLTALSLRLLWLSGRGFGILPG